MAMHRSLPLAVLLVVAINLAVTTCGGDNLTTPTPQSEHPRPHPDVTAPPAQTLVVAGNIATCSTTRDEATAALITGTPGTVLALGDNALPNGTLTNYTNCYGPSWGQFKDRTYAVLGNHEYDSSSTAAGAAGYFGAAAGPAGQGYYSVNLGAWHIVVLNDNLDFSAGSAQEQWLKADLAANTQQCTLAAWHQPRFFSSTTAGWTSSATRKILWDDLYAAGADVVLNGQQHFYERFAPQTPAGTVDNVAGIREFNVGTGGESVQAPTVIAANSEVTSTAYGVLKLTLDAGSYSWQFLSIPGSTGTADAGSGTCH